MILKRGIREYLRLFVVCIALLLTQSAFAISVSSASVDSFLNVSEIEVVQSLELTRESAQGALSFGVSDKVHYVLISDLPETLASSVLVVEQPNINHIKMMTFDYDGNRLSSAVSGTDYVFANRYIEHRFPNFKIPTSRSIGYIVLEVQGDAQVSMPLNFISERNMLSNYDTGYYLFFAYIGIVLAMFLYNIFIYISTRDVNYLIYVGYVIAVVFAQTVLQGQFFQYIVPETPYLASQSVYWSGSLSGIGVLVFLTSFLRTKETLRWYHIFIQIYTGLYILAIVFSLLGLHGISYNTINFTASTGSFILLFGGVVLARKGLRTARFFLLAWSFFLIGVIIFVLRDIGVLSYNVFTNNALMFGSAVELILLSFALADKINTLQNERERSRQEALEATQRNEQLVREQNIILEQKVAERTAELEAANDELSETLDNLKKAQVQLVNAEKMASLGQLTAGIAHEINNPINFVVANVTPLKRDINDLIEVLNTYKKGVADKENMLEYIKEAEELEEEIEIDFVMEEIDQLIEGIKEGASRTAEIVQGLRNFSRSDDVESQLYNVNEGLDSTLVILNNAIKNEVTVTRDYDADMPAIECYPGKLNQVFANLITNAAQAVKAVHPVESGAGEIKITTKNIGEYVEIVIEDNGSGIPEDKIERIFDPFFTTKEVGEGTGLGLSIAYSIIESHSGKISVSSEVGKGTKFLLRLLHKLPQKEQE